MTDTPPRETTGFKAAMAGLAMSAIGVPLLCLSMAAQFDAGVFIGGLLGCAGFTTLGFAAIYTRQKDLKP